MISLFAFRRIWLGLGKSSANRAPWADLFVHGRDAACFRCIIKAQTLFGFALDFRYLPFALDFRYLPFGEYSLVSAKLKLCLALLSTFAIFARFWTDETHGHAWPCKTEKSLMLLIDRILAVGRRAGSGAAFGTRFWRGRFFLHGGNQP